MRLLIVGGSDAGISAALRARELDQDTEITVLLADEFPNYSICGLPFYLSGETPDWKISTESISFDHKAYYPGAKQVRIRVTGDSHSGRLVGAQILGSWGTEISKRVDIFATALFRDMRVEELSDLDLSYTPPLSSPWDPVQMAAQHWAAGAGSEKMETPCKK